MLIPKLSRVLETALYVSDLDKAAAFYAHVIGLPCIHADHRMGAYDVGGNGVLLLFPQGGSLQPIETPGGPVPPHDGSGPMHVAFAIAKDELETWQATSKLRGLPWRAGRSGRRVGSASTSVIRTATCWRSPRQGSGRATDPRVGRSAVAIPRTKRA